MDILSDTFGTILVWPIWIFAVIIGMYWYLTKEHDYWKKAGVPYVPGVPIFGSLGQLFWKPFHEIEIERYKSKGRFYGAYEGRRPVLNIAEPDLLREILVQDFRFFSNRRNFSTGCSIADKMVSNMHGEDWKRVRAIITPTFTTGKIKKTMEIFVDSAKTLTENFKMAAREDKPLDLRTMFGAFVMDVIASAAFATKIDSHNDPTNRFVTNANKVFSNPFPWRAIMFFMMPKVMKFLRISFLPGGVMKFFTDATLEIVENRKRSGKRRNDFLQLLIDAAKEELEKDEDSVEKDITTQTGHEENNDKIFKTISSLKTLSNEELVAQCVVFFFAGFDSTSSTLAFTAYELAQNPDIQDRLIAEIDETIREKEGLIYEAIAEMQYLDKVISETLRKYPPGVRFDRVAEEDYHIKAHDITLPKGMLVGVPVYAMHRDPEHYPDPEKYDPERFSAEQKTTRHPYSYLPFGAGPRNCVGMRFALTQIKACLAYTLSQCRFRTCSETEIPLKYYAGLGLLQPKQVMLKLEIRDDVLQLQGPRKTI